MALHSTVLLPLEEKISALKKQLDQTPARGLVLGRSKSKEKKKFLESDVPNKVENDKENTPI